MLDETLARRATELSIDVRYRDVDDEWHTADPAALAAVVEQLDADAHAATALIDPIAIGAGPVPVGSRIRDAELVLHDGTNAAVAVSDDRSVARPPDDLPYGCHELTLDTDDGPARCTLVIAPPTMPVVAELAGGAGLFVPTYALWDDDQPLPSLALLGDLAEHLGAVGIEAATTLPLYAAFLDEPFDPSPYSPASRLHWNELFLDDRRLPPAPLDPPGRHLDWRALATRRRAQLLAAVDTLDGQTSDTIDAYLAARPDVGAFARFMAGRAGGDARTIRSHELAQFLADAQLAELTARGGAALALDLPIGCHPDGFERWANPDLFAEAMTIGAPPDTFFAGGQNWGLPPQLPAAGRRSGHRLWRELLSRAGEHATVVRIDHVMAVERLWWIPDGFDASQGVYVRYPREELLAVIAATAAATGTTVVGEDLGTVPPEVAEALERWGMLGMYEEQFATDTDPLPIVPARSVAGIRTHDMPPFAAFVEQSADRLAPYRRRLADALGQPVGSSPDELLDAVIERLLASDASLVTIDLDDLLGVDEPHNTPGVVGDTTWRRRLDRSLTATLADPDVARRLRRLGARRG